MKCTRCPRTAVVVIEGRYINGRPVEDARCDRDQPRTDETGNWLLLYGCGQPERSYRVTAVRSLEPVA